MREGEALRRTAPTEARRGAAERRVAPASRLLSVREQNSHSLAYCSRLLSPLILNCSAPYCYCTILESCRTYNTRTTQPFVVALIVRCSPGEKNFIRSEETRDALSEQQPSHLLPDVLRSSTGLMGSSGRSRVVSAHVSAKPVLPVGDAVLPAVPPPPQPPATTFGETWADQQLLASGSMPNLYAQPQRTAGGQQQRPQERTGAFRTPPAAAMLRGAHRPRGLARALFRLEPENARRAHCTLTQCTVFVKPKCIAVESSNSYSLRYIYFKTTRFRRHLLELVL